MEGKSSCCFDDTLRRAANLWNEAESSRTLKQPQESYEREYGCTKMGSHIVVEMLEQDFQISTPHFQLFWNSKDDQTVHQISFFLETF